MYIVMIGTGYVGLVSGTCIAELGCRVTCVDKDKTKIARLKKGEIPIYEPGLEEIVKRTTQTGTLTFSDNLAEEVAKADVVFLAVGTPSNEDDGSADLSYLFAAVDEIADALTKDCVIVTKSTVPVGTGKKIKEKLSQRRPDIKCNVVSNPEFLREGSAVQDFMYPDRIIVGTNSSSAREKMRKIYWNLIDRDVPIIFTDVQTSELIKYAANAYLATKIAFINEMADLCEAFGANIEDVSRGMGSDKRIGKKHLLPGPGYGGSCFPKDTKALAYMAQQVNFPSHIIESVIAANDQRKINMAEKIITAADGVEGKTIAILGLAFKANTDDMRDSASLVILPALKAAGATIQAYDPAAMDEARKMLTGDIAWCHDTYEAMENADFAVILTEWDEFKTLDFSKTRKKLKSPFIIDLRNLYKPDIMEREGFRYVSIGRNEVQTAKEANKKIAQ